jgi:hypothetical protein
MVIIGLLTKKVSFYSFPQLINTKTVPFVYGNETYYNCKEVASLVFSSNYSLVIFITTFLLPFFTLVYVYGRIGFKMLKRQIPGIVCYTLIYNMNIICNHLN